MILPQICPLLVIWTLLPVALSQSECTQDNVDACMIHMKQFELSEYDAVVPVFNESQLTYMCSEYIKTDQCLDKVIPDCHAYTQFRYKSIEDSWAYLCVDKNKEYIEHQECFVKDALHSDGAKCSDIWSNHVIKLTDDKFRDADNTLNTEGWSSLCNFANDYLGCIYTAVEAHCSAEAADWQEGFDDILIQPILQLVGCKKEGNTYIYKTADNGLSQNMIIIVVVSISLGVVAMVGIAILLLRHNKSNRRRDTRSVAGDTLPPPGMDPYVIYSPEGGAMASMDYPPSYKEKGQLGSEYGPSPGSMPPPPGSMMGYPSAPPSYVGGAPPSYKPAASVMGGSVASGHTTRSHRSGPYH